MVTDFRAEVVTKVRHIYTLYLRLDLGGFDSSKMTFRFWQKFRISKILKLLLTNRRLFYTVRATSFPLSLHVKLHKNRPTEKTPHVMSFVVLGPCNFHSTISHLVYQYFSQN